MGEPKAVADIGWAERRPERGRAASPRSRHPCSPISRSPQRGVTPTARLEILNQPKHPELLGHFDTHWGEFELRAEPDGSTTLIGRSSYTLHTRPRWYFDLWTRHLGRAVHLRVMENARRLAEAR